MPDESVVLILGCMLSHILTPQVWNASHSVMNHNVLWELYLLKWQYDCGVRY